MHGLQQAHARDCPLHVSGATAAMVSLSFLAEAARLHSFDEVAVLLGGAQGHEVRPVARMALNAIVERQEQVVVARKTSNPEVFAKAQILQNEDEAGHQSAADSVANHGPSDSQDADRPRPWPRPPASWGDPRLFEWKPEHRAWCANCATLGWPPQMTISGERSILRGSATSPLMSCWEPPPPPPPPSPKHRHRRHHHRPCLRNRRAPLTRRTTAGFSSGVPTESRVRGLRLCRRSLLGALWQPSLRLLPTSQGPSRWSPA